MSESRRQHGGCESIAMDSGQQHTGSRCAWCLAREQMRPWSGPAGAAQAQAHFNASFSAPLERSLCHSHPFRCTNVSWAWASPPGWPRMTRAQPCRSHLSVPTFCLVLPTSLHSSRRAAHNVIPPIPVPHSGPYRTYQCIATLLGLSKTSLSTFEPVR